MIMVWEWVREDLILSAEGGSNLPSTLKEEDFLVDFISKLRKLWNCVGWLYTVYSLDIAIFD